MREWIARFSFRCLLGFHAGTLTVSAQQRQTLRDPMLSVHYHDTCLRCGREFRHFA